MKTETLTFFERTVLQNIDLEPYGIVTTNLFDTFQEVYKIFKSEYVHNNNRRQDETKLFSEWLRGLPSVLTVPFYNHEILANAQKYGHKFETEEQEDDFIQDYFLNVTKAFFTLKENY